MLSVDRVAMQTLTLTLESPNPNPAVTFSANIESELHRETAGRPIIIVWHPLEDSTSATRANLTPIVRTQTHIHTKGTMKFCKNLQQIVEISDPEWAPYWTNYKMLKVRE